MITKQTATEPKRRQDVQSTAGNYNGNKPVTKIPQTDLTNLFREAVENFMDEPIEIVKGLTFKQYDLLTTMHYYLQSRFETGDEDENGNIRYFHNIITHRNAHATKNIDLDTKDVMVTADSEDGWWFSFLLRNEIQLWMRKTGFGKKLNQLSQDLPQFGKVIWKKSMGTDGKVTTENVDLRSCVFDPSATSIKESDLFLVRSTMAPWQMQQKVEEGVWDKDAVNSILSKSNPKIDKFLKEGSPSGTSSTTYSSTNSIPNSDVWDVWGWVPKHLLEPYLKGEGSEEEDANEATEEASEESVEYVYANLIVGGLEQGGGYSDVVYATEADPEDFPYKEVNWFRTLPGRCLPISNTELLIDLQVRMNELVNKFFTALRMGSLHLFQTRSASAYKNLLQDAQDGDLIEVKHEITPIATELRAFQQYQIEISNIENQADRICNTVEVVTGEALPTNTPFRLGAQLATSANKLFDRVREDCGLFITEVMFDWILPEIVDGMSQEHVISLLGTTDELKMFDQMYRKYLIAQSVKDYVLNIGRLPTEDEMKVVEQDLAEQLKNADRKVKVEDKYFTMDKIKSMRIFFDVTDERKNFAAEKESMSNLLQIIAGNPAILQDPTAKSLIGRLLEASGISPITLSAFVSKPEDPQAAAMAAAAPAAGKFAQNPGDAAAGLSTESVAAQMETASK